MFDLAGKMPFDILGWGSWFDDLNREVRAVPVGIEVKVERRVCGLKFDSPMPASWFEDKRGHQVAWLSRLARDGGIALVMVLRLDRKAKGWTMLRVPAIEGDLRMIPVRAFDPVDVAADLSDWIGLIEVR